MHDQKVLLYRDLPAAFYYAFTLSCVHSLKLLLHSLGTRKTKEIHFIVYKKNNGAL